MHKLLTITAQLESGNIKEVDREIQEFQRIALRIRMSAILWYSELFAAMRALMLGNFTSAENYGKRFLKSGIQAKDQNAIHAYAAQSAFLKLELGDVREILSPTRLLADKNPSIAGWRATLTYLLAELGDFTAAKRALSDLEANDFAAFDQHESDGISLNLAASSAALVHDEKNAQTLYEILLPAAQNHTVIAYAVAYFGPVSDRLGQLAATLGIWDASFSHFEDALRRCRLTLGTMASSGPIQLRQSTY